MTDILLARPNLPSGFIDVSVGEPHLVRDTLLDIFDIKEELRAGHLTVEGLMYPYPTGYQPLVSLLEEKHGHPVIITNGAKQALGAVFYALKKLGHTEVGMRLPYWALIPPLVTMHGLESKFEDPATTIPAEMPVRPHLLLAPNNPDGKCYSPKELQQMDQIYKTAGVPLIHDAAYYTHIYLPETHTLPTVGDVQIYSISKMLGFSGLRIGYVVCRNMEFYRLIQEYMEAMTVGVSIASQTWLYDLMSRRMKPYPTLVQKFEAVCATAMKENKKLCLGIRPEVLEVPSDLVSQSGMFGWFKVGPKADLTQSKVNFIDGALFGVPGMVRMNLGFSSDKMSEIVKRLNSVG